MSIEDSMAIAVDVARSYGLKEGSKRAVLSIAVELANDGLGDSRIRQLLDDLLNDIFRYEFGEEED